MNSESENQSHSTNPSASVFAGGQCHGNDAETMSRENPAVLQSSARVARLEAELRALNQEFRTLFPSGRPSGLGVMEAFVPTTSAKWLGYEIEWMNRQHPGLALPLIIVYGLTVFVPLGTLYVGGLWDLVLTWQKMLLSATGRVSMDPRDYDDLEARIRLARLRLRSAEHSLELQRCLAAILGDTGGCF